MLTETHPELGPGGNGTTTYSSYDARGHAHRKLTGTAGGIYDLSFTYDLAERLTDVDEPGHNLKHFSFGYGNGPNDFHFGKLITATRANRMPGVPGDVRVTETYTVNSNTATVSVSTSCTPQVTEQPQDQNVDYGTAVNVHVTVTGCTEKAYMWYSGLPGDTTNPLGGGIYNTPSISGVFDHGPIWVQISGNAITTVNSTKAMISVRPVSVDAHVTSGTNISVTWSAHAHHYAVKRCANGACITLPASPISPSYMDPGVSSSTAYVYSVASVDVYGDTSSFSAQDLATTMTFTPVQSDLAINRTHINELLTAVNLVRAAAGWPAIPWSAILPAGIPAPPSAGQTTVGIYAAHITSLRTQMDLALAALGIPRPAYTDTLTTPTRIKAIHFTELQSRTQ